MKDWRDDEDKRDLLDELEAAETPHVLAGTQRPPRRERRYEDPDALIDARLNGDEPWPMERR